jgi:acyl-CoA synthetase (AMP-forming)/AMP-acid ligase II
VCLHRSATKDVFDGTARWKVTHMGGAPTMLSMIVSAPAADQKPLPGTVRVITGGSPPPPHVLVEMEWLGFVLYNVYGLTETCGVATVCT